MTRQNAPAHLARRSRAQQWSFPWSAAVASLVIIIGAGIALYPPTASWFAQREQTRVVELLQNSMEKPPNNDPDYRAEHLDKANAYNDALAAGAVYEANNNIVTSDKETGDGTLNYWDILSTGNTGAMGRIRYAKLDIDLPILHGTSDKTLAKAVGHLQGTSFPIGGTGTRSVLTAHRGLPSATLFNDLDKAAIGDTFTVTVMGEVLTYRVIESLVIEPDQTEAINADPEKDLITLVTCTPLGINTHRILVTGERILPTHKSDQDAATGPTGLPHFPWWALGIVTVLVGTSVYIWRSGYPPSAGAKKRKATGLPQEEVPQAQRT